MSNPVSVGPSPAAADRSLAALGGTSAPVPVTPWWRFGMVWLVVGGPAIVVVASLGTAVVAYLGADEVLVDTPSARVLPVQPTSETPAVTARNHAATAAAGR